MEKGLHMLGAEFVLDGFHLAKYTGRMARLCGGTEEEQAETSGTLMGWIGKGNKKQIGEWVEKKKGELGEGEGKKLGECWKYLENNWGGVRRRIAGGEGTMGSSTEGHVSHVLSSRMSSRPRGWSRKGADRLFRLRIYYKNGGDMLRLVRSQKEAGEGEGGMPEEKPCLSAAELLSWERQHSRTNGKYIEALRASISHQTSVKVYFNKAMARLF